jgi:hypothetical protein
VTSVTLRARSMPFLTSVPWNELGLWPHLPAPACPRIASVGSAPIASPLLSKATVFRQKYSAEPAWNLGVYTAIVQPVKLSIRSVAAK